MKRCLPHRYILPGKLPWMGEWLAGALWWRCRIVMASQNQILWPSSAGAELLCRVSVHVPLQMML
jgi:hypothetical protein